MTKDTKRWQHLQFFRFFPMVPLILPGMRSSVHLGFWCQRFLSKVKGFGAKDPSIWWLWKTRPKLRCPLWKVHHIHLSKVFPSFWNFYWTHAGQPSEDFLIAHLSLPWSIGWVALSFLVWLVGCPAMVTPFQISLLVAPHPKTHTFSESLW